MKTRIIRIVAGIATSGLLLVVLGCKLIAPAATSKDGKLLILQQPISQNVALGTSATFVVVAMHSGPPSTNLLAYQWLFNDILIPGAIYPSYTVTNAQFVNVGAYRVKITGSSIRSSPAYLGVRSSTSATTGGNGGTLAQDIGAFGSGTAPCIIGTWKTYSYPSAPPYLTRPVNTSNVNINTFDTRNGTADTAIRIMQRSPLASVCCNDDSPSAPTWNRSLSLCANAPTVDKAGYQFIIYVKGSPPAGTVIYLNYLWQ